MVLMIVVRVQSDSSGFLKKRLKDNGIAFLEAPKGLLDDMDVRKLEDTDEIEDYLKELQNGDVTATAGAHVYPFQYLSDQCPSVEIRFQVRGETVREHLAKSERKQTRLKRQTLWRYETEHAKRKSLCKEQRQVNSRCQRNKKIKQPRDKQNRIH